MGQFRTLAYIAAGGIIGSLGRFGIDVLVAGNLPLTPQDFPISTLVVNVLGCLAIGILAPLLLARSNWTNARPFLITGILGALRRSRPWPCSPGSCCSMARLGVRRFIYWPLLPAASSLFAWGC